MADQSRLEIVIDSRGAERNLRNVRRDLQGVEQTGVSSLNKLRAAAVAVTGALAAIGVGNIARATYDAVASSQSLMASLETVTGSAQDAQTAWEDLVDFASNTPFNLDQSVQAFIRMKSLGLDPTESALNSFGNTASAMGKDMMQMVEAVADATTGEFERLKEFGIRASKDGEEVAFTFQGTTTRIQNNADAITSYLERIGNTNFAGAMADQMDTLRGQASNLQDSIGALYRAIGDAGATDAFASGMSAASTAVQSTTEALESGDLDGYLNTAASAAQALSVVVGTRLVTALGSATAARIRDTAASVANARAEATAAQQVTRRTGAELASSRALLRTAQLEVAATRNTNAHTFALQALSAARVRATTAAGAHATATTASAAAMTRASIAARAGAGAMALMGGPMGAALLAAAGIYAFREELGLVPKPAQTASEHLETLAGRIDGVTEATVRSEIAGFTSEIVDLQREAQEAEQRLESLRNTRSDSASFGQGQQGDLRQGIGQAEADLQDVRNEITARQDAINTLREGFELTGNAGKKTGDALDRLGQTADDVVEKFRPMLNQDIESILDRAGEGSTIDETGTLRDAWGNALPTLQRELDAALQEQVNDFRNQQNLEAGLEAAARVFVDEANNAARAAFANVMPTGDQDEVPERAGGPNRASFSSITPMSAEEAARNQSSGGLMPTGDQDSAPGLASSSSLATTDEQGKITPTGLGEIYLLFRQSNGWLQTINDDTRGIREIMQGGGGDPLLPTNSKDSAPERAGAPKSRGSVHVTVSKDGKDVSGDVEGDDEFIGRLANALSGVAASSG